MRGMTFAIAVCSASVAQAAPITYTADAPLTETPFIDAEALTLTLPQFNAAAVSPGATLLSVRLTFETSFTASYTLSCVDLGFSETPCTATGTGPDGAYLAAETSLEGAVLEAPVTLAPTGGAFGDLVVAVGDTFEAIDVTGSDAFEKLMGPSDAFIGSGDLTFIVSGTGRKTDEPGAGFGISFYSMLSDARLRLTYEYAPGPRAVSSEVPLPAAAPLLVAALGWLGLRGRRRTG